MRRALLAVFCAALVVGSGAAVTARPAQTPNTKPISPVAPPASEEPLPPKTLEEQLADALDNGDRARAGELYTIIGQKALDNGQPADAIANLQHALDVAPTTARARYLLAAAFAASGDADRSSREIRAAFDVDPADARAADYRLLAKSLAASGNGSGAADALKTAIRRYPADVDLRIDLGGVLIASGRASDGLFELLYAQMLVRPDTPQAARVASMTSALKTQTEQAKDDPDPVVELVFSYLDDAASDQYELALPTLQEVVSKSGDSAFVPRLLLAQGFAATGRLGESEKILNQLLDQDPLSVPALAQLAGLYYTEGRVESAQKVVDRATRIDPQNPMLLNVVDAWK